MDILKVRSNETGEWKEIAALVGPKGDTGAPFTYDMFTPAQLEALRGPQGERGERGLQGVNGEPFTYDMFTEEQLAALKGEKGDPGDKGDTGAKGDQGDPGAAGKDGKDGVSVTHQWNGTSLTLTSASGTTTTNLQGPAGKDGAKGETGAQGPAGKDGADGKTPVKGTDYFTTAEKTVMVNEVKAAIFAYNSSTGRLDITV